MKKALSTALVGLLCLQMPMDAFAHRQNNPPSARTISAAEQNKQNSEQNNPNAEQNNIEKNSEKAPTDEATDKKMGSEISKELLQNILVDIKKRMVINDENAKLNYSLGLMNGQTYYDLAWESDSHSQSVRYGEDKNIYSYSYYRKETTSSERRVKKLPQYSLEESRTIAKDFMSKVFPGDFQNFKLQEEPDVSHDSYTFLFHYYKDNIRVVGVEAIVTVNYIEGKVSNYNTEYFSAIEYETNQEILDEQKAQQAYKDEIGLKKIYTYQFNEKKQLIENVRTAYVPKFDGYYAIRAKTGKREYTDNFNDAALLKMEMAEEKEAEQGIQPLEQAEIERKSGLKSLNEAKLQVEKLKLFESNNLEISYANLYERHFSTSEYIWALSFNSEADSYSVDLDAKTLDLIGYYDYNVFGSYQKITKNDLDAARKAANDFIDKYARKYKDKIVLNEAELESLEGTQNDVVRLSFERKEGDAYMLDDMIFISYSLESKNISHFNLLWSNIRLPKPTKVADEKIVYDKIFNENKLELAYKLKWDDKKQKFFANLYYIVGNQEQLPLRFAVTTGKRIILPEQKKTIEQYEDLNMSKYQYEAELLHQIGIGFLGGELKPNIPITQRELLALITSAFEDYDYEVGLREQNEAQEKLWLQTGLLLEGETVDEMPAKREDVAKYLIRAMGYQKLAQKKDIFKSNLYDFKDVTDGYQGYVAIAEALRFLDVSAGGEFMPKEQATHDAAIKMLYNFLTYQ
ncbi:MAG: hypothetical protein Q4D65_09200 [Peptostreptococcaceae bacterium]|nr:hypothetical protein [Peptostreptococcaceae bacterium]